MKESGKGSLESKSSPRKPGKKPESRKLCGKEYRKRQEKMKFERFSRHREKEREKEKERDQ